VLWYVSGNRDEAEFPDPRVFDVGRAPNRHLSFGRGGPHLCLGAHLARLEVRIVLAALARRVARFDLAGEPRRIRSNFTSGLKSLPIRVIPLTPGCRPGQRTSDITRNARPNRANRTLKRPFRVKSHHEGDRGDLDTQSFASTRSRPACASAAWG
jgi:hypothetical protein